MALSRNPKISLTSGTDKIASTSFISKTPGSFFEIFGADNFSTGFLMMYLFFIRNRKNPFKDEKYLAVDDPNSPNSFSTLKNPLMCSEVTFDGSSMLKSFKNEMNALISFLYDATVFIERFFSSLRCAKYSFKKISISFLYL